MSRFILPFADVGNGIKPSDGAQLFFFETNTSTPKKTYSDEGLDTGNANTNPVIANGNGVFSDIWLEDGRYKVVLQDRKGEQIWEADPVETVLSGSSLVVATGAITARSVRDRFSDIKSIEDFGATGDGATNNDAAIASAELVTESLYVPDGNFLISEISLLTKRYFGPGSFNSIPIARPAQGTLETVFGFDAGKNISTENLETTMIGRSCGRELTTGIRNTGIGQGVFSGNTLTTAGAQPVTGSNNVGIGFHALKKMEGGGFNVGIGTDAGNEIKSGGSNTLLGGSAGQQITIGFDNTMVGRSAGLRSGLDASSLDPDTYLDLNGTENVLVGRDAGRNFYDASFNVVMGSGAMRGTKDESDFTGNMVGDYNIVLGYRAMYTNPTTAAFNIVIGEESGKEITTARNNVIIGSQAARDNQTGSDNIIIGHLAYRTVTNPENKVILSNTSGLPLFDGDSLGSGNAGNAVKIDGNLSAASDNARSIGTRIRRYASGFIRQLFFGAGDTVLTSGAGSPEGVLSAVVGSMYTRTDGGSGTTLYIKESGTSNNGWVVK